MNLDLKKFVKYIVFIGIIYGAIKLTNNQFNLNKQQMLQLLVVSLVLMVAVDNMIMKETFADTKKEEKVDLLKSADKLDDINLSYLDDDIDLPNLDIDIDLSNLDDDINLPDLDDIDLSDLGVFTPPSSPKSVFHAPKPISDIFDFL